MKLSIFYDPACYFNGSMIVGRMDCMNKVDFMTCRHGSKMGFHGSPYQAVFESQEKQRDYFNLVANVFARLYIILDRRGVEYIRWGMD